MSKNFAIHLHVLDLEIHAKLKETLQGLLAQGSLPMPCEIVDSNSQVSVEATRNLHFIELLPENHPCVAQGDQVVLIAKPDLDYLDLAIRHQSGNIIYPDALNPKVVGALIARLLGDDFFGFRPFFPLGYTSEHSVKLTGKVHRAGLVERLFGHAMEALPKDFRPAFHAQLSELVTNALSYGVLRISAEQRDQLGASIPPEVFVPEDQEIQISVVQDHEKYGISVRDHGGSLTLLRVLQKLRRHTTLPGEIMPMGIEDLTGRGLFIVSRQTRLVINILHGQETEVILLAYFDHANNHYKSLIINEKMP